MLEVLTQVVLITPLHKRLWQCSLQSYSMTQNYIVDLLHNFVSRLCLTYKVVYMRMRSYSIVKGNFNTFLMGLDQRIPKLEYKFVHTKVWQIIIIVEIILKLTLKPRIDVSLRVSLFSTYRTKQFVH